MAVKALGEYSFPSRSRKELYGDDQLVHVLWRDTLFLCAAACFRVPSTMPFGEFVANVVEPWASSDPDFVPGSERGWELEGEAIDPKDDEALVDLGVGHKYLLSFVTGA